MNKISKRIRFDSTYDAETIRELKIYLANSPVKISGNQAIEFLIDTYLKNTPYHMITSHKKEVSMTELLTPAKPPRNSFKETEENNYIIESKDEEEFSNNSDAFDLL